MQIVRRLFLAAGLAAAIPLAADGAPARAQPIAVLAAASLKNALDEAAAGFTKAGGGAVQLSYAASSALARQVEQGAPADIFLSADSDWMDYVANKGLLAAGTRRDLLTNRLALIAPATSATTLKVGRGMPLAQALGDGRLSLAAPEVPAGKYARAALAAMGVWPSVQGRVANAENVRAALQFVSRGEAPFGVVYDTDAKVDPKVKIVGLFPAGSHPRIVYPAAVLAGSRNPGAAAFVAYLQGPAARAVFNKYGFTVLEGRR